MIIIIAVGFLLVMASLVAVYDRWMSHKGRCRELRVLNFFLMFVPPAFGLIGIVVLWQGFIQGAFSLGWNIAWTIILAITAVIALLFDGGNYCCYQDSDGDR